MKNYTIHRYLNVPTSLAVKNAQEYRRVFLLYNVSQVVCSACLPKPVQSSATVSYNPVYSRVVTKLVTKPKSQCQVVQFIKHRPQIFDQQNGPPNSNTILGNCGGYIRSTGTGICEMGFIILLNIHIISVAEMF